MSAILRPEQASKNEAGGTLGALLYADAARARVPEAEWAALVGAVAARDAHALRGLYERAHRVVYTLALRITGSLENAEEVTVDVFHGLWQRAATYDPEAGTVLAWIMNQARSRAIDRWRHEQRKKRVGPDGADPSDEMSTRDATHLHEGVERARVLQRALTRLTPDERVAIETAYFCDLTYAEVASKLQQPLGTIKTRIRTGLARLREALHDERAR